MDRSKRTGRTCVLLAKSGIVAAFLAGTGAAMVTQNVHADGIVRCWGLNGNGQCNTPADLGPCSKVAGGYLHTIALRTDGIVRCWGLNVQGQCNTPVDLGPCSSIAGGGFHTVALRIDGRYGGWGSSQYNPVVPPSDPGPCSSVAAGLYHTTVLRTDGSVRCWGRNLGGACETPADLGPCSSIAAGYYHTIAIAAPPPLDIDGDGRPDSTDNCPTIANPLQADCNSNGVGDVCEIAAGAPDFNQDTIPDACQCLADLFVDHQVNGADLGALLSQWGSANANTASDINRDGKVDGADLGHLLASWGPCPN